MSVASLCLELHVASPPLRRFVRKALYERDPRCARPANLLHGTSATCLGALQNLSHSLCPRSNSLFLPSRFPLSTFPIFNFSEYVLFHCSTFHFFFRSLRRRASKGFGSVGVTFFKTCLACSKQDIKPSDGVLD